MIAGQRRIGGLPEPGHIPQIRYRATGIVVPLDTPGCDSCIVQCSAQREIRLDIILQQIEHIALPVEPPDESRMIHHLVQDGKPVTGRRFGVGAIGPELSQHPGVIAPGYQLRLVGKACFGIDRPAVSGSTALLKTIELPVFFERRGVGCGVIADGSRRDIPHHPVVGIQMGAPGRYQGVIPLVHLGLRILLVRIQQRRWSRIVIHIPGDIIAYQRILVGCRERERRYPAPFRALETLNGHHRIAVLVNGAGQIQRLPPVRIRHTGVARLQHIERGIDRHIIGGHIIVLLIGAIQGAVFCHTQRDIIPEGGGIAGGVIGTVEIDRVPKLRHEIIQPDNSGERPGRVLETLGQQPVGGITDCLPPCRLNIRRHRHPVERAGIVSHRFTEKIGVRLAGSIINGPYIIHEYRKMEQVARVYRRAGEILTDTLNQHFIPLPGDRFLGGS